MDTISQENNSSFSILPLAALVVGLLACILGGVALKKVSDLNKALAEQSAVAARVDSVEAELRKTSAAAESVSQRITKVTNDTNNALQKVGSLFGDLTNDVAALKEAAAKPAPAQVATSKGPVVAGPGEYVVKSGDNGTKIAKAVGATIAELEAVNPGIDWRHLAVGQKLKLPKK